MSDSDKDAIAFFANPECTETFRPEVEVDSSTPIQFYIKNVLGNRVVDIKLSATGGTLSIESLHALDAGEVTRNWIVPDPVHRVVGDGISRILIHMTGKEVGSGYQT